MSVSLTEDAVVARRKTVTRRNGWAFLRPGDRLTLCRKVMGRKAGEPLVRLAEVVVTSVRRERLDAITDAEIDREAVPYREFIVPDGSTERFPPPSAWITWFSARMHVKPDSEITRIEWRYL